MHIYSKLWLMFALYCSAVVVSLYLNGYGIPVGGVTKGRGSDMLQSPVPVDYGKVSEFAVHFLWQA